MAGENMRDAAADKAVENEMDEAATPMPTVGFITLGCAKNEVDTDHMAALLADAGFALCRAQLLGDLEDEEHDEAACVVRESDVVVVNTCSFLTSAAQEAVDTILDVLGQHDFVPGTSKLVVTGCLPSRYGEDLAAELPEVDAFVPAACEDDIVSCVRGVCGLGADDATAATGLTPSSEGARTLSVLRTTAEPWAYVKISEGCDRFCSFCTIPMIRGRYESRPFSDIASEVGVLVARGVAEIVLIGQDTGIWGEDLADASPAEERDAGSPHNLAQLLGTLAQRFPETWFRVMYLQPEGITDELLATMAAHGNLCDYLDIPLQHADAHIIADMNRSGDAGSYLQTLARIRGAMPDVTLRSTFIAGFPGETDDQFDSLVDFVDEAAFDYAVVFPYSTEEGTRAGNRDDQVDEDVRERRARELLDHAEQIGHARAAAQVGQTCEVLICGLDPDSGRMYGRTQAQAPDVDGVVYVEGADESMRAHRVRVTINAVAGFELEGTLA